HRPKHYSCRTSTDAGKLAILESILPYRAAQSGLRRAGTPGRAPRKRRADVGNHSASSFFVRTRRILIQRCACACTVRVRTVSRDARNAVAVSSSPRDLIDTHRHTTPSLPVAQRNGRCAALDRTLRGTPDSADFNTRKTLTALGDTAIIRVEGRCAGGPIFGPTATPFGAGFRAGRHA